MANSVSIQSLKLVQKCREGLEKRKSIKEEARKKAYFLAALAEAKEEVLLKRNHFENVTEDKLLDCCIFELTAAESRLNYYLSVAKKENMTNNEFLDVLFYPKKHERSTPL